MEALKYIWVRTPHKTYGIEPLLFSLLLYISWETIIFKGCFMIYSLQKTVAPPASSNICTLNVKHHRYASLSSVLTWCIINKFIYTSCKENLLCVFAYIPDNIIFTLYIIHKNNSSLDLFHTCRRPS